VPKNRYFISEKLDEGNIVELSGSEFHHMHHVMRKKEGDGVELIDGKGSLAKAQIASWGKDSASLVIESKTTEPQKLPIKGIGIAIIKQPLLEFAIEKCCETGADQIILFGGDRGEKKECSLRDLSRLEAILISSTKQCGRLFIPELHMCKSLKEAFSFGDKFFYGAPCEEGALYSYKEELASSSRPIIFIGPEGGFSDDEKMLLQSKNAIRISLGPYILRTETAAPIAASAYSFVFSAIGTKGTKS
jgi:16S rRNA (uracil1498-N3)-methyltransferase